MAGAANLEKGSSDREVAKEGRIFKQIVAEHAGPNQISNVWLVRFKYSTQYFPRKASCRSIF